MGYVRDSAEIVPVAVAKASGSSTGVEVVSDSLSAALCSESKPAISVQLKRHAEASGELWSERVNDARKKLKGRKFVRTISKAASSGAVCSSHEVVLQLGVSVPYDAEQDVGYREDTGPPTLS